MRHKALSISNTFKKSIPWPWASPKTRKTPWTSARKPFLSAFQHLSSLRESAAFPHWLCQIAANQCRRLVKSKGRFLSPKQKEDEPDFFSSLSDDPETLPEQVLDKEETRRLMEETVQQLPDVQRECVLL